MLAVIVVVPVVGAHGIQIGVARDADDVHVFHAVHAEHVGGEHLDNVLKQNELEALARQLHHAVALVGQRDEAQKHAFGAFFLGFLIFLIFLLLEGALVPFFQAYDDVELAVFQVRERVTRIDDLRRQEGLDVHFHVVVQEFALLVAEVVGAQMANALAGKVAANALVDALFDGVELVAALVDGFDLLRGRHAGFRIVDGRLDVGQVGEAAHAHHEELLQVAPENGDEIQALQQRNRLIGALVEHAFVEGEPRKLAVLHERIGLFA